MQKFMTAALLTITLSSSTAVLANDQAQTDGLNAAAPLRTTSYQLCDYWQYNFDIRAYACAFLGPYIDIGADRSEAEQLRTTVATLEQKLEALEARLAELEGSSH